MEIIRFATPADKPAVLGLLRLMHAETGLFPLAEDKVVGHIDACLKSGAILLSCEEDDEICGTLGLLLGQPWYSDAWQISDQWFFVHPDHRRSRHARRLLEGAKDVAAKLNMPLVMGVFTDRNTEGKCRLFARHLQPIGQIFLQRAPDHVHEQ